MYYYCHLFDIKWAVYLSGIQGWCTGRPRAFAEITGGSLGAEKVESWVVLAAKQTSAHLIHVHVV